MRILKKMTPFTIFACFFWHFWENQTFLKASDISIKCVEGVFIVIFVRIMLKKTAMDKDK